MTDQLPNPLMIELGEGRISLSNFSDDDGYGIIFKDSGEPHEIGSSTGEPGNPKHEPEPGEVYLKCSNRESALVLMEKVCRILSSFEEPV